MSASRAVTVLVAAVAVVGVHPAYAAPPTAPFDRAYERVSPGFKNGGDISSATAIGGDRVIVISTASFLGEDPSFSGNAHYLGTRSQAGWALAPGDLASGTFTSPGSALVADANDDFSRQIVTGGEGLLPDDQDNGAVDVYMRTTDGLSLVSTGSTKSDDPVPAQYVGRSADASHILFQTTESLELEDAGRASGTQLYERVEDQTRVVALDDSGDLLGDGGATLGYGSQVGGSEHPVSDDGSRIFFTSPDPAGGGAPQLYARVDGQTTMEVSAPQRTTPGNAPQPAVFQGASPDGAQVVFTTTGQLVDGDVDDSTDLYRYELATGELTRLSGGTGGAVQGADVTGVAGISDRGDRVYYLATGPVAPGAVPGRPNLFATDGEGTTTHVATLLPTEGQGPIAQGLGFPSSASISADGETLVFATAAQLTSVDNGGATEVYRYQVATGELTCPSCNETGAVPLGDASLPARRSAVEVGGIRPGRFVSDDGSIVVFDTLDALDPRDTNGERDAYEWRAGRGASLLTLGTDPADSGLIGMTPDGRDVLFTTYDQLVQDDTDPYADLYDARVGGGFPPPPPPPQVCAGDACQGEPSGGPDLSAPGSRAVQGLGNAVLDPRLEVVIVRPGARARRRAARTGRLRVRMRTTTDARLRVGVRARLRRRGKVVRIGRTVRVVRRAARPLVTIRLDRPARRALSRRRKLVVRLQVRADGTETRTARFGLRRSR